MFMSELTVCNYCSLKRIREDNKGKKIEVRADKKHSLGGYEVTVNGKMVAWFMALTDHCVC
jgi:hypothetical protein